VGIDVTIMAGEHDMRMQPAHWLLLGWLMMAGSVAAQVDDREREAPEDKPLKIKLAQACFLSVVDGKLIADSKLKGARLVDQAVEVEEMAGSSILTLKPEFLRFENTRAVSDGIETLRIENRNDVVRIERSGREATVYYRESSGGFGAFGNDGVRMSVYGPDGTMLHSLTANDFQSLTREHRAEVYQYLGPILRLLRTEGVIGADQRKARQVLITRRPAREVEPQVQKLVLQLDADSFKEREKALGTLRDLGPDALAVVEKMNRKHLSPQQQTGIEAFISDVKLASLEELDRLRKDPQFLVECLYCEDAAIRAAAVERLKALNRGPIGIDAKSDPLAQAAVIEELRNKLVAPPATKPSGG
jgi:hypothetical protein